jgi:hypothetical protein
VLEIRLIIQDKNIVDKRWYLIMAEYKSLYINKTWNEIANSFAWFNCKTIKCRMPYHEGHYDLQCLQWAQMILSVFEGHWNVIYSYMQNYKITDILDFSPQGWKILEIDKKIVELKSS